jgi:MinD-like ATPase involved in chromosome partitioning or flagellar assembly
MLIGLCSDKASPGATTTALTLASAWPDSAIVVEADPDGGDLAIRLRTTDGAALPGAPTVLTVAAASRTSATADLVGRYAHTFTSGVSVIAGHLVAEQSAGVAEWDSFGAALAASESPVFLDLGRLHGRSPLMPIAAMADVLVVVARPDTGSVIRLRERLARLTPELASRRGSPPCFFPILVSAHRHGDADVGDLRRILAESPARPFLAGVGFLAFDPRAVRRLEMGEDPASQLARTPLLHTARGVVVELVRLLRSGAPTEAATATLGGAR